MPRGGRRPGADAPKGNMNALKSGRYSPRFNAVRTALSQHPEIQAYLAALRRQQPRTKRMAAAEMHTALLEVMSVPPLGATPSSPICGRRRRVHPARQGTRTEVNQRRTIQQLRQGRPPGKQ